MNSLEFIDELIKNIETNIYITESVLKTYGDSDDEEEVNTLKNNLEYLKERLNLLKQIKTELIEYNEIKYLMEKYKINSIEELENILIENSEESHVVQAIKYGMDGAISIVGKGMLYNKLSEELGCPLPLIFDAIKKGIVVKPYEDEYGDITLWNSRNETELDTTVSKLEFEEPELLFFDSWVFSCSSGCYRGCVKLKDYGKTWWLKGDKDA